MSTATTPHPRDSVPPIDKVLTRLTQVRQRQPSQWSACCPAHADGSPSLSVRETPDGAVLLHCFGGCSVAQVCDALGLQLSELFPRRASLPFDPRHAEGPAPTRLQRDNSPKLPRLLTAPQALALLRTESLHVAVAACNLARGTALTEADRLRLLETAGRVAWLHQEACA